MHKTKEKSRQRLYREQQAVGSQAAEFRGFDIILFVQSQSPKTEKSK